MMINIKPTYAGLRNKLTRGSKARKRSALMSGNIIWSIPGAQPFNPSKMLTRYLGMEWRNYLPSSMISPKITTMT
jgi:hypothetical protein